jgi:hypothetical protein
MFVQKNSKVVAAHLMRLCNLQVFGLTRKTNILYYILCQLTLVKYFMVHMDKFVVILSAKALVLGILKHKL